MSFIKYYERLKRIDDLIRRRATGTPKELADKIGVSERWIYECLKEIKLLGGALKYCDKSKTYFYENERGIELN
jgi:hypothetical protein